MSNNNVAIPFPLSDGSMMTLYAPPTMSVKDARRLKRLINALYINSKPPQYVSKAKQESME